MKNRYIVYHARWQLSALVMMPLMLFLEQQGLALWVNLMIGQFVGALLFWSIDKYIFKYHNEDTIEEELNDIIIEPSTRKL